MNIYQVDMRNGDANYAYLTLYLFTKSENKPTNSQINKCLELDDEIDVNVLKNLNVLGIDDSLGLNDYDFSINQINNFVINLVNLITQILQIFIIFIMLIFCHLVLIFF